MVDPHLPREGAELYQTLAGILGDQECCQEILSRAREITRGEPASPGEPQDLDVGEGFDHLRWFPLPHEVGG